MEVHVCAHMAQMRSGPLRQTFERAAALIWHHRLSDDTVAEALGVSLDTLVRWKALPEVRAIVRAYRSQWDVPPPMR
ncbi:MAG TPA: hypothetical protein VD789_04225 [Thermomicrobiales bacterium]|nr:hypothetical protein [Thermomicrobiales bacterium]